MDTRRELPTGHPVGLDLEGNPQVGAAVRPSAQPLDGIRRQVADEESEHAVAAPLSHVHLLMTQQVGRGPSPPDDDESPDGDAISPRRHRTALPQQVVATLLECHVNSVGGPTAWRDHVTIPVGKGYRNSATTGAWSLTDHASVKWPTPPYTFPTRRAIGAVAQT